MYRIKKVEYKTRTEYWVQKSQTLFGYHLFWYYTTFKGFSTPELAEYAMNELIAIDNETRTTSKP